MALPRPAEARKKKYYTVDEANKALPLVKVIVADIVRQWRAVKELEDRLSALAVEQRRPAGDPYTEELAHFQAELEAEQGKLEAFIDELTRLGVELKSHDGLCDFYSLMDGREVYLCWRLGEPEVLHWHELNAGFAGRQPLVAHAGPRP
jgi:hypothetical protein